MQHVIFSGDTISYKKEDGFGKKNKLLKVELLPQFWGIPKFSKTIVQISKIYSEYDNI